MAYAYGDLGAKRLRVLGREIIGEACRAIPIIGRLHRLTIF